MRAGVFTLLVRLQVRDAHVYDAKLDNTTVPRLFRLFNSWETQGRASVLGEFGGYGLNIAGHMLLPPDKVLPHE